MRKQSPVPLVRHSYASDPNTEKVEAALEVWRSALARKMARYRVADSLRVDLHIPGD